MVGKMFNTMREKMPGRGSDDLCGFCYGMNTRQAVFARAATFCESVYARSFLSDVVPAVFGVVQSTRDERAIQRFEEESSL